MRLAADCNPRQQPSPSDARLLPTFPNRHPITRKQKMNKTLIIGWALALWMLNTGFEATAGGFKGAGGGRASGAVGTRGGARPASLPHMGGGMSRPSMPAGRPSISRPSLPNARPSLPNARPSLPNARPSLPNARPSLPNTRPSLPNARPTNPGLSGGWKPTTRPSTLPSNRPSLPSRPTTLPGNLGSKDRPALNRPDWSQPNSKPGTRPSFPSLGGNSLGGIGTRPANKLPGNTLPGNKLPGGVNRPSVTDVGDFLGIQGGVRPTTLPGKLPDGNRRPDWANRPEFNRPEPRPVIGRPGGLELGNLRPGMQGRPGLNPRPIEIGNIQIGNNTINNRPAWVNIDRNTVGAINNRWQTQIGGLHGWAGQNLGRIGYWRGWGDSVRFRWNGYHHHNHWFAGDWCYRQPRGVCRWHYYHRFNDYPWAYWWQRPQWTTTVNWFVWTAPPAVWSEPIYYDYGKSGNVTYQDNRVYINETPVATASQFAESAAALATVDPPASQEQAEKAEWLPLGTFALSTDEADVEPSRVVQLAVDQSGIIAGTLYNRQTDVSEAIQGRVDKDTQRAAMRLGESDEIIAEAGLYNLTQDEVPLLVHFGSDRVETYVLVRLKQSGDESETAQEAR